MDYSKRDLIAELASDLNTLTTIAQANVITKDVKALAVGETRPAAVLFLDIVEYSKLSRQLPTENLTILIDRIFQIFSLSVKAYGGYCDKVIGDAGLYVFPGHPAHPPAIEGALRAGLVILERASQIRFTLEPQGIDFNLRVGVAFGDVTRQRVGGDESRFTVNGEPVNLAQRLEVSAEPGTMQILKETADTVSDLFIFKNIGKKDLRNLGTYSVLSVVSLNERVYKFRSSGAYLSRFVGREKEFGEAINLIDKWLETRYNLETLDVTKVTSRQKKRNRLLVVRGGIAVGKSRMAYELLQHFIKNRNVNTCTAHCLNNNLLDLFAGELVRVAGVNTDNLPERWEELCKHAETAVNPDYADRQRRHLPLLGMLLDCPRVNTEMIQNIDARSFILAVQMAFCATCELVAHFTQLPVIVVIEDLQWLSSYEELLANILNSTMLPQPLIIVGTARPEFVYNSDCFDEVCEYHELNIAPIDAANGRLLVESILPGLDLSPDVWHKIVEKADGIPYYYEEFARMLVRRGYVVEAANEPNQITASAEDGNGYAQTDMPEPPLPRKFQIIRDLTEIELPTDIQMLILGKLDQLEPKLKLLVSKASVLGRAFIAKLLIEIERKLADGEPDKLPAMLHQLLQEEIFVRETKASALASTIEDRNAICEMSESLTDDKYFFKHIVTQESAYKAMLERNKWLLHSLAADVLETLIVPGSVLAKELLISLIMHLTFLQRHLKAHKRCCELLTLLANTGQLKDWDVWENKAAIFWKKALINHSDLPEQSPCQLLAVCEKNFRGGDYNTALPILEMISEAFDKLVDKSNLARALHRAGAIHLLQSRFDQARLNLEQAITIRRELGDRQGEAGTLHNIALIYVYQSQYNQAQQIFEESLAINQEIGDMHGEALTLQNIGNILCIQGNYDLALQYYEKALSIHREISDRLGETSALHNIGIIHSDQGRFDLAMQFYEQSLSIGREISDRRGEADTLHNIGIIHKRKQRYDLALQFITQSLEIQRENKDAWGEAETLNSIGDIYCIQGELEKAMQCLSRALEIQTEIGARQSVCYNLETVTQIMIDKNDITSAKDYCTKGEEIANEINDLRKLGFFKADWAMIYALDGDLVKAESFLQQSMDIQAKLNNQNDFEALELINKTRALIKSLEKNP